MAAAVTTVACERARAKKSQDPWLKLTLLGAAFDAGDASKAEELINDIRAEGAVAWQLKTALDDLRRAIAFHAGETAEQLAGILKDLEQLV